MLVIGFGHKARQGKNSAAVAFCSAAPVESRVRFHAFADALRAEVSKAVNGSGGLDQLIETWKAIGIMPAWVVPECGKPRTLLQWWGTDYRRAKDPDYWVKKMRDTLDREQPEIALITDVRFRNEADLVHELGGTLIKVTRTTPPDIVVPAHPSEDVLSSYNGWDYELAAGTLHELKTKAAALYRQIAGVL